MSEISIQAFYKEMFHDQCPLSDSFLSDRNHNIGHFNVFNIADMYGVCKTGKPTMPYNRRTYYKISLINGNNTVEFADKVVEIKQRGVLFASPRVPYRYTPLDNDQSGYFCVFTADFMQQSASGLLLDSLPLFTAKSDFVYQINEQQYAEIEAVFLKMSRELASDYQHKYELLRHFVVELILTGQKLLPAESASYSHTAGSRISTLFIELLERQFPIEAPHQILKLKTAKEYAESLNIHVNHLNKVLKETTGKTTTEIVSARIAQEARILLKQTDWTVSEIAFGLGFDEVAHFSNFFKKHVSVSPLHFRDN